jgi:GNAT superfamily N-acetyltransferase
MASGITVHPLVPERWSDLERLFGPSGVSNCWCTYLRQTGAEFSAGARDGGAGNKGLLRRLCDEGAVPGLIGYAGGEPVGWVSVAPRPQFGRCLRSPILRPSPQEAADPTVWVVACFFVPRAHRDGGVATALLSQAIAYARQHGAADLEAYPVDTRGARAPSATLYTGILELFLAAGFVVVSERLRGRPVVRLALA